VELKKIVLFGYDGYWGNYQENINSFYRPEDIAIERKYAVGNTVDSDVAKDTTNFNSYFWNKYWTFKDLDKIEAKEFSQFILVTLIGLAINSSIVYGITTLVSPMFGISPELWANLAKVAATGFSLIWNFIGYKFVVFNR